MNQNKPASSPDHRIASPIPVYIVLALVILWALVDVIRSYPSDFFPRFWDEARTAMDVMAETGTSHAFIKKMPGGPVSLGYGLPLSIAVLMFGEAGVMHLSTVMWLLALLVTWGATHRWFGGIAGMFATAFLAYSPLFGKYVAEAGPTTLLALLFLLLWVTYQWRWSLIVGFVVGMIAFVDLRWVVPVGLSILTAELVLMRTHPWKKRLFHLASIGLAAVAVLGVVWLIYRPFGGLLREYLRQSTGIVHFALTGVFGYYLWLFSAVPAVVLAMAGYAWPAARRRLTEYTPHTRHVVWVALFFCGVPIFYHSVMGISKALRLFAVVFPLLAALIGAGVGVLVAQVRIFLHRSIGTAPRLVDTALGVMMAGVILLGSDGPARHLRLETGFEEALDILSEVGGRRTGSVSSYLWPVVQYGWGFPTPLPPFAMRGFLPTDKWVILDPMADRVTLENRQQLEPEAGRDFAGIWAKRARLQRDLDFLFSVRSDFYASDYFLCENTVGGIATLSRWQSLRRRSGNVMTIYPLAIEKTEASAQAKKPESGRH